MNFYGFIKSRKRSIFEKKWANKGKLSTSFNMCIQYFSSFLVLRCLLIFSFGYKYIYPKAFSPLLNISHSLCSMTVLDGRAK